VKSLIRSKSLCDSLAEDLSCQRRERGGREGEGGRGREKETSGGRRVA